jgi:hypothetical protein
MSTSILGFCDLPPEIRLEIYRYCFIFDDKLRLTYISIPELHDLHVESQPPPVPEGSSQLLACSKLLLMEGRPVLYGENRFHFRQRYELEKFIQRIGGKEVAKYIKHVSLVLPSPCRRKQGKGKAQASRLARLCNVSTLSFTESLCLKRYSNRSYCEERDLIADPSEHNPFGNNKSFFLRRLPKASFLRSLLGQSPGVKTFLDVSFRNGSWIKPPTTEAGIVRRTIYVHFWRHLRYEIVWSGDRKAKPEFDLAFNKELQEDPR